MGDVQQDLDSKVNTTQAECDRLRAKLAEAERDTARLEWLIAHQMYVEQARDGRDNPWWYAIWSGRGNYRVTPAREYPSSARAAIDAAMEDK